MGNYASGRYRWRNRGAVEMSLRLSLRRLRELGAARPGSVIFSSTTWTRGGEKIASISHRIDMGAEREGFGFLRIDCQVNGQPFTQTLRLESTPCRYGGRRWWILCPRYFSRHDAVYFDGRQWCSRTAARLTYQCQSEDRLSRAQRASRKAEVRAFGLDGHPRPRGRNRERLEALYEERESVVDTAWLAGAAVLLARLDNRLGRESGDAANDLRQAREMLTDRL